MNFTRLGAICTLAIVATCARARAGDQLPWWAWSTLDGNWGGYRDRLADDGILLSGVSIGDLQGNVSGGTHRSFAYAGTSLFAIDTDLDKLVRLRGSLFHAEFIGAVGQNLSTKSVGNLFQVATAYSQPGAYLGQIYLQQKLFDDVLKFQVGRMTTASNFGSLPVFSNYVSFAINPIPVSLSNNTIYFTSSPSVGWAAVTTLAPSESIGLAVGVYNTNLTSAQPVASSHGLDWSFNGNGGPLEVAQVTYNLNQGREDTGLPGTYYLGGFYSGANYQVLPQGESKRGSYGFYLEGQQMIYRSGGPGSSVGLTPWAAIASNPDQSVNQIPLFVSGGAVYQGLIKGRGDDTAGVGFYYGKLSSAVPAFSGEKVLEVAYMWWATPWLGITPDLQYVFSPSGHPSSKNATVLGVQFMLLF